MKVAVLGDAPSARRTLDELVRTKAVDSVTSLPTDASVGDLVDAARSVDALVAVGGTFASTRVALAAITARCHAVLPSASAGDHRDHIEFDNDAREVGVKIVTGASAMPALAILLARQAALGLDEVRAVEVAWAIPPEALADAATARAVVDGVGEPAVVRSNGSFTSVPTGRPAPVAFPEPVGTIAAGAFFGPEVWRLADAVPGRPRVEVRLGVTVPGWGVISGWVRAAARAGRAADAGTGLAVVMGRAGRVLRDPGWAAVRVEVEGPRGGVSVNRVLGGFDRLPAWDAAALTIGVLTLGHTAPGVSVAGTGSEPAELLRRLYDSGIRFAAFEPAG